MVAVLGIVAGLALLSASFGLLELAQTWTQNATVFQQISARVDVGLSLLVFVTSAGFASILSRLDRLADAGRQQNSASALPTFQPSDVASVTSAIAPSEKIETGVHRGVTYRLEGRDYRATVNGVEVTGSTPDIMHVRISRALDAVNPS